MAKTSLDLNDYLFEQMERLNELTDEDIKRGKLKEELARTDAMTKTAVQIIANGKLSLDAMETFAKVKGKVKINSQDIFKHVEILPSPVSK